MNMMAILGMASLNPTYTHIPNVKTTQVKQNPLTTIQEAIQDLSNSSDMSAIRNMLNGANNTPFKGSLPPSSYRNKYGYYKKSPIDSKSSQVSPPPNFVPNIAPKAQPQSANSYTITTSTAPPALGTSATQPQSAPVGIVPPPSLNGPPTPLSEPSRSY